MVDLHVNQDFSNEVMEFETDCPNCLGFCSTKMKKTDIPFFKSVIIMSTSCDSCGVKSNEVKSGNGISEKGIKYTLKITDKSDLSRDILKSEDASMEIPEIDFSLESGTLGGKFTTIEGILQSAHEQLSSFCLSSNDEKSVNDDANTMKAFLNKLKSVYQGEIMDITVILDDPAGNSYMQNTYAPMDDPNMIIETYERDYEQNEMLGLNDINTENYLND